MKIIQIDNFGREEVADILIADNVNEYYAKIIIEALNKAFDTNDSRFFVAKADDYKLWKGMEELV